jgi:chaperone BCS1
MFYGVPGTGKSTSIVTIDSYLKKDIYYLNMNTIKTNAELQMIFDYVLKNCSKTGIIVIEEIEKQTDIVFKDHELEHETMTDILDKKEGKLNLSYFLNLLDGTLSQEETVYIMTTNHIDKLEPALYRSGRIDKMIEFKKCDKYQIEIIYERIMKRKIDSNILKLISEDTYTLADIIFHLVSYIYETKLDDEVIMEKFITDY